MRPQSHIKVIVRDVVIGGPRPLVCVPLVAENFEDLVGQAEKMAASSPDLMEWRLDHYRCPDTADTTGHWRSVLEALRDCLGDLPLILTCRRTDEGGVQPFSREKRLFLIKTLIRTGHIDLVDIEMANDDEFIREVQEASDACGARRIYSFHDFSGTPELPAMIRKIENARNKGAHIAKLAVTPTCHEDVLTLMQATLKARTGGISIPLITLSMGDLGRITRIAGGLFGSDITFAAGETTSAPGQMPICALRQAMAPLYS
ncbi:type I 3-dehydroquinate dehydratase [Desulfosarcina sp. OttesenSCG-928-A07]|nr:type I 3-dehydroquinate dehydratase [Desulfosarcina sp. OttesenSCG-928-G17]MDL2329862.1 type I 3-dehydroquinate dehydratase [Desulfosarcina sp. OttesenSCG-928-A07]